MGLEDLADNLEDVENEETIIIEQSDDGSVFILGYSGSDELPATTVDGLTRGNALKELAEEIDFYESTPEEDW